MNKSRGDHLIKVKTLDGKLLEIRTNKFRHRVYQTLKKLNKELGRVVVASEVSRAYLEEHKTKVVEHKKVKDAICKAILYFVEKDLVFSRKQTQFRLFGTFEILDPKQESTYEGIEKSVWQKILRLVHKTVEYYGNRPVRCHDVSNYAKEMKITEFTSIQITYNIWSLYHRHRLKIVGKVQNDGAGSTLFLPSNMKLSEVNSVGILTFTDFLLDEFKKMWRERIEDAKENNCLIRPILTSDLRKRIKQADKERKFTRTDLEISTLLTHLAKRENAQIRSISLPNRVRLWVWNSVKDEQVNLDNIFTSDAHKLATAVKRAYLKAGKRPVTTIDIKKELSHDQTLKLIGKMSINFQLSVLVNRKNLNKNEKLKNTNFKKYIRSLGSIGNKTYYAPAKSNIEKDQAYFEFHKLSSNWMNFKKEQSWQKIENCRLNSVRTGRVKLFVQEIQEIQKELFKIDSKCFQREYNSLVEEIELFEKQAINLLKNQTSNSLPEQVNQKVNGLISKDTTEFLAPFYPAAARLMNSKRENSNAIISRISHNFRRIPNPYYKTKNSRLPKYTNRKMFELTDLYIQTALRWGGSECRYQASIAVQELGNFRDERFVIGELNSKNFENRQIAIACLSYLQTKNKLIEKLSVNDPVPEIRQAALWAFAFVKSENYKLLAERISKQDSNLQVRNFAKRILDSPSEIDIWRM